MFGQKTETENKKCHTQKSILLKKETIFRKYYKKTKLVRINNTSMNIFTKNFR